MEFVDEQELKDAIDEVVPVVDREQEDIEIEQDLEDWVEDDETIQIKSLFNDDMLSSVEQLVSHDLELYEFDLKKIVADHCSDDLSVIKLINFIRARAAVTAITTIDSGFIIDVKSCIERKEFLEGDVYMKPVIEDDPLLYLYEETLIDAQSD